MPTSPQDSKTMSFRISKALWIEVGDRARRLEISIQKFCTEAIVRHLKLTSKEIPTDDINGKSVRAVLRKKRSQGGE